MRDLKIRRTQLEEFYVDSLGFSKDDMVWLQYYPVQMMLDDLTEGQYNQLIEWVK